MQIGLVWHQNADVQFDLFGRSTLRFEVLRAQVKIWPQGSTSLVEHSLPTYSGSLHSYVETFKK